MVRYEDDRYSAVTQTNRGIIRDYTLVDISFPILNLAISTHG